MGFWIQTIGNTLVLEKGSTAKLKKINNIKTPSVMLGAFYLVITNENLLVYTVAPIPESFGAPILVQVIEFASFIRALRYSTSESAGTFGRLITANV